MAKIPDLKRIRKEDFAPEEQDLVDKIAYSFNTFGDQVVNLLTKNVGFDNLNQQYTSISVQTDGLAKITSTPKVKVSVTGSLLGIICINAKNLDNPNIYPTSTPFVSFEIGAGVLTITNISGLPANSRFSLTLMLIGI